MLGREALNLMFSYRFLGKLEPLCQPELPRERPAPDVVDFGVMSPTEVDDVRQYLCGLPPCTSGDNVMPVRVGSSADLTLDMASKRKSRPLERRCLRGRGCRPRQLSQSRCIGRTRPPKVTVGVIGPADWGRQDLRSVHLRWSGADGVRALPGAAKEKPASAGLHTSKYTKIL